MPGSIDGSDPEHFLAMQVAARALADSGYDKRDFDRSRTSVIIGYGKLGTTGMANAAYHTAVVDEIIKVTKFLRPDLKSADLETIKTGIKANLFPFTAETCPGLTGNIMSGRIANRFNLQGPSFTVDAACASSLIALDMAVTNLRMNKIDMAIVGGVHANVLPGTLVMFSMLGALARSGRIRPFSAEADGTLLSEGVGMAIVKRLEDARKDGDRIYATIRGIGASSDGRGQGLLTPRLEGEALALSRAYESCGIDPASVGLFEAHGTATKVGDATEILALSGLLGPRKTELPTCALGSVKSMIGHTIPASGMAGLIKTALALHKKILPATLCEQPNPELGIEKTPLYLNTKTVPWISGAKAPRRAGVSAFGFGGINAHVVLEEETTSGANSIRQVTGSGDIEVYAISAGSKNEMIDTCNSLLGLLQGANPPRMEDLAFSLAAPSTTADAKWRLAVCASGVDQLSAGLTLALTKMQSPSCVSFSDRSGVYLQSRPLMPGGKLALMFPGEGAQYAEMLRTTTMAFPKIRSSFDEIDRIYREHGKTPLPSQVLYPPPGISKSSAEELQKLLWSNEYGLMLVQAACEGFFSLVQDLELAPDAVVGHSGGQNFAMWLAGCFTADRETFNRHLLRLNTEFIQAPVEENARLLVVGGGDPSEVMAYIKKSADSLFIAMDNCPNQIIICGVSAAIERAMEDLGALGAICSAMPFQRPYHTPLYSWKSPAIGEYFNQLAELFTMQLPQIPVYSSSSAALYPNDLDEIKRMLEEQWEKPVRFRETVEKMYDDGFRIFLEAGPRGNLCGFVNDTLSGREFLALEMDVVTQPGPLRIAQTFAQLFVNGVKINLTRLHDGLDRRRVSIPGIGSKPDSGETHAPRTKRTRSLKMGMPIIDIAAFKHVSPLRPANSDRHAPETGSGVAISGIRRAVWNAPVRLLKSVSCSAAVCSAQTEITNGESLAALILSVSEKAKFSAFSSNLSRANEWLFGRLAAKDAVNQLLKSSSLTSLEILTEKSGRPYFMISNGNGIQKRFLSSIAHCGKVAAAIAAPEQAGLLGIGVDVELRERPTTDLEESGFKETERSLIRSFAGKEAGQLVLKLWCVKEAVAKAIGTGLVGNPCAFEIVSFDESAGLAHVNIDQTLSAHAKSPVQAFMGFEGNLAYAIAAVHSRT